MDIVLGKIRDQCGENKNLTLLKKIMTVENKTKNQKQKQVVLSVVGGS